MLLSDRSRRRNPRQWSSPSYDRATSHPGSIVVPCQALDECASADRVVNRFDLSTSVFLRCGDQMAMIGGG